MNAADVLTAILAARDKGEDPALILDENSPLMDAAREALRPKAPPEMLARIAELRPEFSRGPIYTRWGAGTFEATFELSRDSTARLFVDEEGLALIQAVTHAALPFTSGLVQTSKATTMPDGWSEWFGHEAGPCPIPWAEKGQWEYRLEGAHGVCHGSTWASHDDYERDGASNWRRRIIAYRYLLSAAARRP